MISHFLCFFFFFYLRRLIPLVGVHQQEMDPDSVTSKSKEGGVRRFRGISDGLLAQTGHVCFLVESNSESHVGSAATWEWPSRTLPLPPGGLAVTRLLELSLCVRNAVLGLRSSPLLRSLTHVQYFCSHTKSNIN